MHTGFVNIRLIITGLLTGIRCVLCFRLFCRWSASVFVSSAFVQRISITDGLTNGLSKTCSLQKLLGSRSLWLFGPGLLRHHNSSPDSLNFYPYHIVEHFSLPVPFLLCVVLCSIRRHHVLVLQHVRRQLSHPLHTLLCLTLHLLFIFFFDTHQMHSLQQHLILRLWYLSLFLSCLPV